MTAITTSQGCNQKNFEGGGEFKFFGGFEFFSQKIFDLKKFSIERRVYYPKTPEFTLDSMVFLNLSKFSEVP